MENSKGKYAKYIISPFNNQKIKNHLQLSGEGKTLFLARDAFKSYSESFVVQNFTHNLAKALENAMEDIKKYKRFILIYSSKNKHPDEIPETVNNFCKTNNISFKSENKVQANKIQTGDAYFIIEDSQMLKVIEYCEENEKILGRDIGILSYNDTPMKRFVKSGISCISTDFTKMGKLAGEWLMNENQVQKVLSTNYIKRNSL